MFRWCELMQADQSPGFFNPGQHVALVYADRMRTEADKAQVHYPCCNTGVEGKMLSSLTFLIHKGRCYKIKLLILFKIKTLFCTGPVNLA